jgi:hypothetical protein
MTPPMAASSSQAAWLAAPTRRGPGVRPSGPAGQVGSLDAVALAHRVVQTRPSRSTM